MLVPVEAICQLCGLVKLETSRCKCVCHVNTEEKPACSISNKSRIIGLTGGIGAGKTTVGMKFQELGAAVFDADQIARDIVVPGQPAWIAIKDAFGKQVISHDFEEINRKKLAEIVFNDVGARKLLEGIMHPMIASELEKKAARAYSLWDIPAVIYDAALLVETGSYKSLAGLVVVAAKDTTRISRIISRDDCSAEGAVKRIDAQMPQSEKIKVADWVIWNDGSKEALDIPVASAWNQILDRLKRSEP